MIILDASAILAFLKDEPGADLVEESLLGGATCSAANWAEVAQKVMSAQGTWEYARTLLTSYPLVLAPVTVEDAEAAARLWAQNRSLALGDRLCLALALRLGGQVLTCDRQWAAVELPTEGETGVTVTVVR